MNTSTPTRPPCAAAALLTSLSLLSGVAALGDTEPAPTRMAQITQTMQITQTTQITQITQTAAPPSTGP